MRTPAQFILLLALVSSLGACAANTTSRAGDAPHRTPAAQAGARPPASPAPRNALPVIHVFVALCDNEHQGIVPVPQKLGDGEDPASNLYWGAAYGVKTFFRKSKDWELVAEYANPRPAILERLVLRHRRREALLVADAYRGSEIKQCTVDFLEAAAGAAGETLRVELGGKQVEFHTGGSAGLLSYVGHDGLRDFRLPYLPQKRDDLRRDVIILACASKNYFAAPLRQTGATPLLWTTNLMAPEAYTLERAADGWLNAETGEQVRARAAAVYNKYQRCGLRSATNLFATGF
jgi:hypothetical protein